MKDSNNARGSGYAALSAAILILVIAGLFWGIPRWTGSAVMAAETSSTTTGGAITTTTGSAVSVSPTAIATAIPTITNAATETPTPTQGATPTETPTPTPEPTPTPMPDEPSAGARITYISASYTGGTVIVGDEIDTTKLNVYVYYDDGYYGPVTEYELAGKVVEKEGNNRFVVIYEGFTADFNVVGKTIKSLNAVSARRTVTVGNGLDERDITATITFSNGTVAQLTKDYTISPSVFTETGEQKVTITYRNISTEITVTVKEAKEVKTLSISYDTSKGAYTKMAIDRSLITVTAVYVDNTSERITTYTLSPERFSASGSQKLTAEYKGKSASLSLNVLDLAVTSIRAEYKGPDVYVGMDYNDSDLHVYAKYNSDLEEETTEYKVYNKRIRYIGTNTIKIYLGDFNTTVTIIGKEMGEPDFNYVSTATVTSNGFDISIDTAIPPMLEEDATELKAITKTKLKHLYRRLGTKAKTYLGFKYGFSDLDNERYLPLTVRITLPDDYEPAYTELYYSPNNKTILGCMNKMGVDEHTLEVTIFNVGTYMLVYDPAAYEEDEVPPEE